MLDARENLFLRSLSPYSRTLLINACTEVSLPSRTLLYEPDKLSPAAFFLTSGLASVMVKMPQHTAIEVEVVGREGVVAGVQAFGAALPTTTCTMQVDGAGFRMNMRQFQQVVFHAPEIRARLLELVQVQVFVNHATAACHAIHEAEANLVTWLLTVQDRTGQDTLLVTQELLAELLGTRRTTVTMVAGNMQRAGLIEFRRGKITILDRAELEKRACACYLTTRTLINGLYSQSFT